MICTTIQNKGLEQIYEALEHCEMAEIRLDRCELTARETEELFTSDIPLVATCRISELAAGEPSLQKPELTPLSREIKAMQMAEKRLIRAIEAGARYVDVEIEAQKQMSKRVRQAAHENGTIFIRSYHDFEGTSSFEALKAVVEKCVYHGADMVKIVTTAHSEADVEKVLALYEWCREEKKSGNERIGALADGGLLAFCMGEAGRQSRVDCLKMGAPYTYAALSEEEAAAPGQWAAEDMKKEIYGDFPFIGYRTCYENTAKVCQVPQNLGGPATLSYEKCARSIMPVSKSFAQRAIIAAALAEGTSHLRGYTPCGDNEAAIQVAKNLGAEVCRDGNILTIKGISAQLGSLDKLQSSSGTPSLDENGTPLLHVGESGLLTRMMIPVMAQLCPESVTFTGEKTLLGRPLTGAREIMEAFDATVTSNPSSPVTSSPSPTVTSSEVERSPAPVRVPLTVQGPLKAGRAEISGKHGSQLISGLLMALPFSENNTSLIVREPKSIPYMFITLEVLKKFGIRVGNDMYGGRDFLESDGDWSLCTEMVFKVKGGQKYKAADIDLEGDWSAAANFLVAGAVFGKAVIQGLDTTSLQADLSIMDILMDAGASLSQLDGDRGDITVQRAPLKSFDVDASNCPDLFPIISVLAAFCQGTSRLAGVGRLANKESDRAKAIIEMLTQMGVKAWTEGDVMHIEGHTLTQRLLSASATSSAPASVVTGPVTSRASASATSSAPASVTSSGVEMSLPGLLKGGHYTSHHDHRMVMALKVAALGAESPITIDDEECVAKSFPQFHSAFAQMCDAQSVES
ncbi:MAG: type I 3-dehydroquinate dehydratase [Bacteroidales bacterium]|nr:type I 3-dehydroquinate dehydratase [Bacteroidales bacterium]